MVLQEVHPPAPHVQRPLAEQALAQRTQPGVVCIHQQIPLGRPTQMARAMCISCGILMAKCAARELGITHQLRRTHHYLENAPTQLALSINALRLCALGRVSRSVVMGRFALGNIFSTSHSPTGVDVQRRQSAPM
jgi:hypothetical protein